MAQLLYYHSSSTKETTILTYRQEIERLLAKYYATDVDPRHILGYMRLCNGTLDGLSAFQFECEFEIALGCVRYDELHNCEALARSYGMLPDDEVDPRRGDAL